MSEPRVVQGRRLETVDLVRIRKLLAAHPNWTRRRLSEALAAAGERRNDRGQRKDMAARSLLVKLHGRGLIELSARRRPASKRMAGRRQS